MANYFPLIGNPTTKRLEELKSGDFLDLTSSGIFDGTSTGTIGSVLKSTGTGVSWGSLTTVTEIQNVVGSMVSGNTETNVSVTYDNVNGKLNFNASSQYTLPTSSTLTLGGVKIDGTTITISGDGVISAPAAQSVGSVNNLSDVSILFPSAGQVLRYNGTEFVNSTISYIDIANRPTIPAAQVQTNWNATSGIESILNKPILFSGSYLDLSNKPNIPAAQVNSDWNATSGITNILNKPTLATVATTGSYTDLTNKPTIPPGQVNSDWSSSSGLSQIFNKPTFATVATTGSYTDLTNRPTLFSGDYFDLSNRPVLFSGSYNSLTNKPEYATVASSGSYIDLINKPTLSAVASSGSYNDLSNKPSLFSGSFNDLTNKPISFCSQRTTSIYTTQAGLQPNATDATAIFDGFKSYSLLKISTSAAAWVVLYTDSASRSADLLRDELTDPEPGSGVIAEIITTGSTGVLMSPGYFGFNNDTTTNTNIYAKITNKSASSAAITITLSLLQLEK